MGMSQSRQILPPSVNPASQETALIYLGAASISLHICHTATDGVVSMLDHLEKPLATARDIFRTGTVSRATMEQAATALREFALSIREYGIAIGRVRLYATNILSEATNPEVFLNRLHVVSGCEVRLLDEGDMTRLIYMASLRLLEQNKGLVEGNTLVSHIGPGNTRALLFKKGRVALYTSYRLGIFRAREAVSGTEDSESLRRLSHLEEQIRGVVDHLAQDFAGIAIDHHVAIGAEIQSVAPHIVPAKAGACAISEKQLNQFTETLARLSPEQLVRKLSVHYTGSEGIVPALQTNLALARLFGDEYIHVPARDFQRDLMLDLMNEGKLGQTFHDEILTNAHELGRRYKADSKHADHVAKFAQQIFREMQHLHALPAKFELILSVAASLHEIGMFVSAREHHKHSMYLILNTELFGVSREDRTIVALLARYHRRYNPEPNHPHFSELSREQRMIVFKLAAILRVADALDRSHSQRIKTIVLKPRGHRLLILTPGVEDTTVEQIAINSKCDLFREIFGYEVVLTK
jgi:exopolyphosphatase / guanosine-5'-triphosphate,3'-diphosphate pyrophosphatase